MRVGSAVVSDQLLEFKYSVEFDHFDILGFSLWHK